jgi:hypothetical protein
VLSLVPSRVGQRRRQSNPPRRRNRRHSLIDVPIPSAATSESLLTGTRRRSFSLSDKSSRSRAGER